jgi:hypothetical protein
VKKVVCRDKHKTVQDERKREIDKRKEGNKINKGKSKKGK